MSRLKLIKEVGDFLTCQDCRFTYIAFSSLAERHCPKCDSDKFESDESYLNNEEKTSEEVSIDSLNDDFPKMEY